MKSLRVAAVVAVVAVLAGCGSDEIVNVTVTQRTGQTPPPTVPQPPTVPTTPSTEEGISDLELRLPPSGTVPDMASGSAKSLPTAESMVRALYREGDPGIPGAISRLESRGYEGGVLRDQTGTNPGGARLVRMYVMRMADESAARGEVYTSIREVKEQSAVPFATVPLKGSYGEGIRGSAEGMHILMVSWSAGRELYGVQTFATTREGLHEDEIVEAAARSHLAWGGS